MAGLAMRTAVAVALTLAMCGCGAEESNQVTEAGSVDDDVTPAGDPNGFGTAINMSTNSVDEGALNSAASAVGNAADAGSNTAGGY